MGFWTLVVNGVGRHGNPDNTPDNSTDADRMFGRFVDELREAGHLVEAAVMITDNEKIQAECSTTDSFGSFAPVRGLEGLRRPDATPGEPALASAGASARETDASSDPTPFPPPPSFEPDQP